LTKSAFQKHLVQKGSWNAILCEETTMKKKFLFPILVLIFAALFLGACTRPQTTPPPSPTVEEGSTPTQGVLTQLPEAIASQTAASTVVEASPTTEAPIATEAPPEPTAEPPTATSEPPTSLTLVVSSEAPTKTPAPQVPTPQGDAFNPFETYGDPTFVDPMNSSSYGHWESNGRLPNSELIQISLDGDSMYVTGKKPGFSTWYFSWPTLTDFYQELTVDTGACSGKDEYGLIVRGPAHGAGVSYGYIVAFSCDGHYRVARLDSADPFTITDLVASTKSANITSGANEINVIGIKAQGQKLTIFANGYQVAEVSDATFSKGRYGFFVQAVETVNYTYHPIELIYWVLGE
jgi:hypothetical protein